MELVKKRSPEFSKDSEVADVKSFYDKWNEIYNDYQNTSTKLYDAKHKLSEEQKNKAKLEVELEELKRKLINAKSETEKKEIQKEIDALEIKIGKLASDIQKTEHEVQQLESEVEEGKKINDEQINKFDSKDLMNEMALIVVKSNYKELIDLYTKADSIHKLKLKALKEKKNFSGELIEINTQIAFYDLVLEQNKDDEEAKSELSTLKEKKAKAEKDEVKSNASVTGISMAYNRIREEIKEWEDYLKDYKVEEETFDAAKMEEINDEVTSIFNQSFKLNKSISSIFDKQQFKEEAEQEIQFYEKHLSLLASLKTKLETLKNQIDESLKETKNSILTKTSDKALIEAKLQELETEISQVKAEIVILKKKEEEEKKKEEEEKKKEEEEKKRKKRRKKRKKRRKKRKKRRKKRILAREQEQSLL